jgi:DNA-binding XRE family transcriptional regulator
MIKRKDNDRKISNLHAQIIAGRDGKPEHAVLPIEAFFALLAYAQKGEEALEKSKKAHKLPKIDIETGLRIFSESFAAGLHKHKTTILNDENFKQFNLWISYSNKDSSSDLANGDEESEDNAAFDAAMERNEESFPAEIADQLVGGASPIKTFRKYRGMTQSQLAEKIGTTAPYLSQIETGRRTGSVALLSGVASALDVDIDDLV